MSARAADFGRIARLAWPVFVGQIAVVGFSTIDTLLIARHAATDLAALSVGASIYVTIFVGLMGAVLAIGPIVGRLFGAGEHERAGRQLHQSAWLALALAAAGSTLLAFPQPLLALAQAPAEVEARIRGYLLALAVALPGALLMQCWRGFNNAISRPKVVMLLNLAALALKLPLSALLIFGAEPIGLPPLGLLGCGIATAVLMWLQPVAAGLWLRRDGFYRRFALTGRGWDRPDRAMLAEQVRLGLPMGASIMVEVSGFTFMAIFIARLGVVPAAGQQIAANLTALVFMIPLALSNATTTLVAQRLGARDPDDVRRLGRHGLELVLILALAAALLLGLGRGWIAERYTRDPAVLAVAVSLIGWLAVFHVADAVQTLAAFVLRAYHVVTLPMLIYAGSLWGIGLGGGYVLAFHPPAGWPARLSGAPGYWVASTAGLVVAGSALLVLWRRVRRREERRFAAVNPPPAAPAPDPAAG